MERKTLGDIYKLIQEIKTSIELFGATADYCNRFNELILEARTAIMDDQKIADPKEAKKLPLSTELGEKSLVVFNSMEKLLASDKKLEQGE